MEKGNSFIRNLDIDNMVTPSAMEEKVRYVMNYIDSTQENLMTLLNNNIELKCKEATDSLKLLM